MIRRSMSILMLVGASALLPVTSSADVLAMQIRGVKADDPLEVQGLGLPPDSIVLRSVSVEFLTELNITKTGSQTASTPQFSPLAVVKELAASSPRIFLNAVRGRPFEEVKVTFYRTDRRGETPYFRIELQEVFVASQQWLGSQENAEDAGLERVELTFSQIRTEDIDTGFSTCFDVKTNSAC